jgi:hypothetical protein
MDRMLAGEGAGDDPRVEPPLRVEIVVFLRERRA